MAKKNDEYLTQEQLAREVGVTPGHISRLFSNDNEPTPARNKEGLVNRRLFLKYWKDRLESKEDKSAGKWGREKQRLECRKLEIQIDEMEGRVIVVEDHKTALLEMSQKFVNGLNQIVSEMTVLSKDPEFVEATQKVCNRVREAIVESLVVEGCDESDDEPEELDEE